MQTDSNYHSSAGASSACSPQAVSCSLANASISFPWPNPCVFPLPDPASSAPPLVEQRGESGGGKKRSEEGARLGRAGMGPWWALLLGRCVMGHLQAAPRSCPPGMGESTWQGSDNPSMLLLQPGSKRKKKKEKKAMATGPISKGVMLLALRGAERDDCSVQMDQSSQAGSRRALPCPCCCSWPPSLTDPPGGTAPMGAPWRCQSLGAVSLRGLGLNVRPPRITSDVFLGSLEVGSWVEGRKKICSVSLMTPDERSLPKSLPSRPVPSRKVDLRAER